jgi:hypothetical protein
MRVAGAAGQTRTQGVELIVHPLLSDTAISDQAATMTHRSTQRT